MVVGIKLPLNVFISGGSAEMLDEQPVEGTDCCTEFGWASLEDAELFVPLVGG